MVGRDPKMDRGIRIFYIEIYERPVRPIYETLEVGRDPIKFENIL